MLASHTEANTAIESVYCPVMLYSCSQGSQGVSAMWKLKITSSIHLLFSIEMYAMFGLMNAPGSNCVFNT